MCTAQEALESSYELCFNAACALIDEGRLKEAEANPTLGTQLDREPNKLGIR